MRQRLFGELPAPMANVLDLSPADFRNYLAESQSMHGYTPDRINQLRAAYRHHNSLSGALDRAGEQGLDGMNTSTFLPLAGPQGMSIWDALKSGQAQTRFKDWATDAVGAVVRGVENPRSAAQGLLSPEEMNSAAMETAAMAMLGGGAVPKPKDALGANALRVFHGGNIDGQVKAPLFVTPKRAAAEYFADERAGTVREFQASVDNALDLDSPEGLEKLSAILNKHDIPHTYDPSAKYEKFYMEQVSDHSPYDGSNPLDIAYVPEVQAALKSENIPALYTSSDLLENTSIPSYAVIDESILSANANASTGALVLGMQAKAEPRLAKILADRGIDPSNADAAPLSSLQDALDTAASQGIIDPRSASSTLSHFADRALQLEDFYANASKGAGAAAMLSADASKMTKAELDPLGYQNTKMDKPLSEVEIQAQDLNENLPRQEADIEALEGKVAIPFYGDRSSRGLLVSGVDDVKFDQPVYTEGGIDFMVGPAAQADRSIWASDQGIITRLTNEAIDKAKADGKDVVGTTISMAPDAVDFTNFAAATMAEMIKAAPIKKKDAKLFDQAMKKVDPNWPGVLSADLRTYVEQAAPGIRKVFIRSMDSKPAQMAGFPSPAKMRLAVTDPSQVEIPSGQTGLALGQIDVGADALSKPSVPHSTYDTQMTGTYLGGIPAVPQGLLYRDFYKTMDGKKTKTGQPFSESHKTYAMKTVVPGQEFTPEIIDYLMKLKERQK